MPILLHINKYYAILKSNVINVYCYVLKSNVINVYCYVQTPK